MANYTTAMRKIDELLKVTRESTVYEARAGTSKASVKGTAGLGKRISKLPAWMAKAAKSAALEVGVEGFKAAMSRVPIATGKLATSGKLWLGNKVYARGMYSGGNNAGIMADEDLYREDPFIPNAGDYIDVAKGTVNIYIEFNRLDEKGDNLAWYLHENLNEYGSGVHPEASKPGRGPKYVEGPMNEIIIPKLYNTVFRNIKFLVARIEKNNI